MKGSETPLHPKTLPIHKLQKSQGFLAPDTHTWILGAHELQAEKLGV